jgi:hypothetical protein
MILTLNKNGRLADLWGFTYGVYPAWYNRFAVELPRNFCKLFWGLVLAATLFPITWISFPYKRCPNIWIRLLASLGYWIGFVISAAVIFAIFRNLPDILATAWFFVKVLATMVGIALIGLAIIVGIFYLISLDPIRERLSTGLRYLKRLNPLETEAARVAIEAERSFKQKYCPFIDWK